jgi:DNA-binding NtrC family response regulator
MSTILIVEDEHALGSALVVAVRRLGHVPELAASGAAALEHLATSRADAVVLDIGLPDMSGVEVLERIRREGSQVPVLVITAHAMLDHAIATQKLGIADYLIKPLDLAHFEQAVSALVAKGAWVSEITDSAPTTLIGAAACMHEVFLAVARACAGEMPVLISGPCGSGKSLAARVIHANGIAAAGELETVECGTVKAADVLQGLLERTHGTLVLENLTDLETSAQAALAERIAQRDQGMPRLIATMQDDPRHAVANGRMREDLFYAFSALVVAMPPLRERTGDIPALSRFLLAVRGASGERVEITAQALQALQAYDWPGNVRELRHALEHARAMSRSGPVFPGHLPPHIAEALRLHGGQLVSGELDAAVARWIDSNLDTTPEREWRYDTLLDHIEASMLRHLLTRFAKRPTHLAQALAMNRATLRQKLRRIGLSE